MQMREMGDIELDEYGYRMYVGCGGWLVLSREALMNFRANIERVLASEEPK